MRSASRLFLGLATILAVAASSCSKQVPDAVSSAAETLLPVAIQVAENGAKLCPSLKASAPFQANPLAAPPPPPSPAIGSALASHRQVFEVFIMCMWPDPRDPTGNTTAGTSFPKLNGKPSVPVRPVTMPEDLARNTCKKDPRHCEQVVVPSRHIPNETSADIRVTRKTVDGTIEVTVVLAP